MVWHPKTPKSFKYPPPQISTFMTLESVIIIPLFSTCVYFDNLVYAIAKTL